MTTDPPDNNPLGSDEGRPDFDGLFLVNDGEDDAHRWLTRGWRRGSGSPQT
ncbi:hypothetical protein [Actinomycetospora sp. CA-053990]|uniref:hypothetical protein n=1 Tax=Actinomycetospora sp. CA-053990 TaxID=3239891 RepID=UPI003D90CB01